MKIAGLGKLAFLTGLSLSLWLGIGVAATTPPLETVQQVSKDILDKVRNEENNLRGNPDRVRALIDEALAPHVDFPRMARLVLGKHWKNASNEQKGSFTREFRSLLVRFYSNALADYLVDRSIPSDLAMTFMPFQGKAADKRVTVRTKLHASGYPSVPVNYSLYLTKGAWKVYDVTVSGISLILNYRSSFAGQIREKGLDGLIKEMAEKNAAAHNTNKAHRTLLTPLQT